MSENKEPHFFVHGYGMDQWEDYLALFRNGAGRKAIGESSTGYLFSEESPAWIKSVLGDIRIILLLRNPARRAFSLYAWMAREGYEDAPTFAEGLEREPARMRDPAFRAGCPQFYPDYLYFTTGLYFEQVSRYFEIFGRERVRIFLFEEFVKQPESTCREVFCFLEVEPGFKPRIEVHNEGRLPRSIPFQHWLRTRSARRWGFMPRSWRTRLANRLMERNVRRGNKPQLESGTYDALTERYRQNVRQLESLLARDLTGWLKPAGIAAPAGRGVP